MSLFKFLDNLFGGVSDEEEERSMLNEEYIRRVRLIKTGQWNSEKEDVVRQKRTSKREKRTDS